MIYKASKTEFHATEAGVIYLNCPELDNFNLHNSSFKLEDKGITITDLKNSIYIGVSSKPIFRAIIKTEKLRVLFVNNNTPSAAVLPLIANR
jgi:hypothetical protein